MRLKNWPSSLPPRPTEQAQALPTVLGGKIERAEPDTELHCSPVLRPYAVTTRLRQGFLLCLAYGGQDGGQAGDSERRRGGAQRRPPPPLGLSKAHIPARQRKGTFFSVSPGGFASKRSVENPRACAKQGRRI